MPQDLEKALQDSCAPGTTTTCQPLAVLTATNAYLASLMPSPSSRHRTQTRPSNRPHPQPLLIFSANVQRFLTAHTLLLEEATHTRADITLVQEPWIAPDRSGRLTKWSLAYHILTAWED